MKTLKSSSTHTIKFTFFIVTLFTFLYSQNATVKIDLPAANQNENRSLTFLTKAISDTLFDNTDTSIHKTIYSRDSARIISPKHYSILNDTLVTYTIEPNCAVEHVILYVSYFPKKTDTLARLSNAPYTVVWNNKNISDQDQFHLQFGYILFHTSGDTIISLPEPHHWIINRDKNKSKKRYVCKEAPSSEAFIIDGKLDDWVTYPRINIPFGGSIRCSWTSIDFFIGIEVYDPFVTKYDKVEISFDMADKRQEFVSVGQRILSYSPLARSFPWALSVNDTSVHILDSLVVRINEEMEWSTLSTMYGYTIESRIPLCVLYDLSFPLKSWGFDVTVINKDDKNQNKPSIYTWSGAEPGARHTPAEWGTITLSQQFLPLKFILLIFLFTICIIIILILFLLLYQKQKNSYYEKLENQPRSDEIEKIFHIIENNITHKDCSPEMIANKYGCTTSNLEILLANKLNSKCQMIITSVRIKKAKQLLVETDQDISEIADSVGYKEEKVFEKTFKAFSGVYPLEWRENRRDDECENEEDDYLE